MSLIFRVKESYYGKKLNGPNLSKLLRFAPELTDYLPDDLKKFGLALQALDKVKKACFSMTLDKDWEKYHTEFIDSFNKLEIPMFPKLHILQV